MFNRVLDIGYSFPMAVVFKGSCGPLRSSPTAKGVNMLFLALLVWGWLSAREMLNLRIRVTMNACIWTTLLNGESSAPS